MGCDYIIKNILEVTFATGMIKLTLDEMRCYFKDTDSFEFNSDCSDYDSDSFLNSKYLSTESYKNVEIYNNTSSWKNDKLREKYQYLLDSSDIDLKNVLNIIKKQVRYLS
jgi:hypothetical protein